MPRRSRSEPKPKPPARVIIGGNGVASETMRKHSTAILALQTKLRSVQQELKAAYQAAESDGIARKPFKAALKLLGDDPASADAYMRQFDQYTHQLGLFDAIKAWKQEERDEANGASVEAASRGNGAAEQAPA